MDNFDIALNTVDESKLSIMINCQYFKFTVEHYEEISNSFPDLRVEFILKNQMEYIDVLGDIQMDSILLENLIFSKKLESVTVQTLINTFGTQHMTARIAGNLKVIEVTVQLDIFKAAWECLNELSKQKLMFENLELLDADSLHSCFTDLEIYYSAFLDRSKQHNVELANTPENLRLAEQLQAVEYITSYRAREKKEFDPITEAKNVTTVISCRVKAIK